jgi:ElaB/YqjD/DUF883 family membrane-anchored ribosome-binding protein
MGYTPGQNQGGQPSTAENLTEQKPLEPSPNPKDDLETLRADLKGIREDLTHVMEGMKGTAGQKVKEVAQNLKESGEQVGMPVLDQVGRVKEKGTELAAQLEEHVRERPMTSLLVAFGAGLILSRMMERR